MRCDAALCLDEGERRGRLWSGFCRAINGLADASLGALHSLIGSATHRPPLHHAIVLPRGLDAPARRRIMITPESNGTWWGQTTMSSPSACIHLSSSVLSGAQRPLHSVRLANAAAYISKAIRLTCNGLRLATKGACHTPCQQRHQARSFRPFHWHWHGVDSA